MVNVTIVHGTKGSPSGNWFPWLAAELSKQAINVKVPKMPTPEGQSFSAWRAAFNDQVGPLDEHSILIGHSVGGTFAAKLVQELKHKIYCLILVAPPISKINIAEYDFLNASFMADRFDWFKIRDSCEHIYLFCSDDDPYVPFEQPSKIAEELAIDAHIVPGGGHLNAESGFLAFPLLLELLRDLLHGKV